MAWKQDSIKQVEVSVVQDVPPPPPPPEGEGKAEMIDVYSSPSSGSPGDTLHVRGGVKNTGGKDMIRLMIGLSDGVNIIDSSTNDAETWPEGQVWYEADFIIPEDYDKDVIYVVGIGFHEE